MPSEYSHPHGAKPNIAGCVLGDRGDVALQPSASEAVKLEAAVQETPEAASQQWRAVAD